MMPPLAHQVDVEKLRHLLFKGDIDIVESDHAPHSYDAKMQAEVHSGECKGVPGGEFAMPLLLREVKKGRLELDRLVQMTSTLPAAILGVKLSPKTKAKWIMQEFRYSKETHGGMESKAGWNPFLGMMACGKLVSLRIKDNELINALSSLPNGKKAGRVIKKQGAII